MFIKVKPMYLQLLFVLVVLLSLNSTGFFSTRAQEHALFNGFSSSGFCLLKLGAECIFLMCIKLFVLGHCFVHCNGARSWTFDLIRDENVLALCNLSGPCKLNLSSFEFFCCKSYFINFFKSVSRN